MTDVERTFQQCPDCGQYRVKLSTHRCDDATAQSPTRAQRVRSAEADPRDDDEDVLLLPSRTVDGSYAYHETDGEGLPACGGGGALDDEEWVTLTRREARERSHSPCKTCLRLTVDPADTSGGIEAADESDATGT